MIKIAPSILSANFLNLENEIKNIEAAGADILHLDVMDGHFVRNLTFGLPIIKQIKNIASIPLDVHLMVTNPESYLQQLAEWNIEYVSIHQEVVKHLHYQISVLKKAGVKAGVVLNPATPVSSIIPLIPELDFVLLMSVNPGFGGQKLLNLVFPKIKELKQLAEKYNSKLEIEVDGGVNGENADTLIAAGADILVAGSYIFSSNNYKERIQTLKQV